MLIPLAIATLGVAVAGDEDDPSSAESVEAQFRLRYAMGDKIDAYHFLFEQVGQREERGTEVASLVQRQVLRPLLYTLARRMATQETLEGVKDVLGEIEAVLSGWSSWPYAVDAGLTIDIRDVTGPQQHSDVETFQWTGEVREPQRREMIPHFEDLKTIARAHGRIASIALRVEQRGRRIGQRMITLVSWDAKDRALVQWIEHQPGKRRFGIEHFEIWPMGQYLEELEKSERG